MHQSANKFCKQKVVKKFKVWATKKPNEEENNVLPLLMVIYFVLSFLVGKYQKETEQRAKSGSQFKTGRWTKDEHIRFLEALKLYGKEWRTVQ